MSKGFDKTKQSAEERNQQAFFRALWDSASQNKHKGVFLVEEGTIAFSTLDNLKRFRDALPLRDRSGHNNIIDVVEQSNPEIEIVLAIAGDVQLISREKLEKAINQMDKE
jgi:hypothetical protein